MAAILVTGGAGFIGSNLVDRLVDLGHAVRVVDDFSTGRRENLAHLQGRIDLVEGTICDPALCRSAARGCELVFHLAADVSVPRSMVNPESTHRTNVDGLYHCLEAAREAGARRFVFASSSAVYGDAARPPTAEDAPLRPISPYGASKAIGELYCYAFAQAFGLETVSLRYFNVFGPRQDPASQYAAAIPAFLSRMIRGARPVVFGDGTQSRDFTYIDNVVEANLLAAKAPKVGGQAVNIACGRSATVNEAIGVMNELLAAQLQPQYDPPRPGDVKHSGADVALARKLIGYEPIVSFREGLRKALDWYRKHL